MCYCCNLERVSQANWQAGHVQSKADGGQDILSNLRPVCARCNVAMGRTHMKQFALQNGFAGRIVSEVPPQLPASSGTVTAAVDAADSKTCCANCKAPRAASTLKLYDGMHCKKCFDDIYWFAIHQFKLEKAPAGSRDRKSTRLNSSHT